MILLLGGLLINQGTGCPAPDLDKVQQAITRLEAVDPRFNNPGGLMVKDKGAKVQGTKEGTKYRLVRYKTIDHGRRAMRELLEKWLVRERMTVERMIAERWAPGNRKYARLVAEAVGCP